jgi:hypothetical protein
MISYIDDFKLMMIVTLLMIPFLPLLSKPQRAKVSPQEMIVHD